MQESALSAQIQQLRQELDELEAKLRGQSTPLALLEDLKASVDQIRTTLWAAITAGGDVYAINAVIVKTRMNRARDMCRQIMLDIDASEITVDTPELGPFWDALTATQERVKRLHSSGM